jgi:protein gp37
MSDGTLISWTDASWPVMTGCDHVSEGCDHCYAAKLTSGLLKHVPSYAGLAEGGRFNGQVRVLPERLDWPFRWRKPRKIFVADMGDLFHAGVPENFIGGVWNTMALTERHTYQVLTKRHARMRSVLTRWQDEGWYWRKDDALWCGPLDGPLSNVWCGVSAENEKWFDTRAMALMETPAAVRFISAEPLLGPIRMRSMLMVGAALDPKPGINWVIVGGESGPGHRPMDIAWLESIVSQCRDAGVAVWVKQDSGPRAGQQGRIPDDLWIHEFPLAAAAVAA